LLAGLASPVNGQTANNQSHQTAVSASKENSKQQKSEFTISGKVIDSSTKKGLKYVLIYITGTSYTIETDSLGRFSFNVPEELRNTKIIFETDTYTFGKSSTVIKAGKYPSNLKISLKKGNKKVEYRQQGRFL